MANTKLRKSIALGSVAILLLIEFSFFSDFFYPFRFLWNHRQANRVLSVIDFILLEPAERILDVL